MRSVAPVRVLPVLAQPALHVLPALLVLVGLLGCANPATSQQVEEEPAVSRSTTWEPYTRHQTIEVNGAARGYLVTYDPIPIHASEEVARILPTGSHRILDERFHDIGFITSKNEVHCHSDQGDTVSLGVTGSLEAALALIYEGSGVVTLRPLSIGSSTN